MSDSGEFLRDIEERRKRYLQDIKKAPRYYRDEYPDGLDLHPSSPLHEFIINQVMERVRAARETADRARAEWRRLDWTLSAFVPATDAENLVKRQDLRKPVQVVIPMSFASLETYLTYMAGAFSGPVIHKYKGRGTKRAKVRAALLERVISAQNMWFKEDLKLQTHFRDAFVYGIGAVSPVWSKHKARRPVDVEVTDVMAEVLKGMKLGVKENDVLRYLEEHTLWEGNELRNIDPYQILLDPNVPINEFQRSEFFGYLRRTHAMEVLRRETDPELRTFNGRYVQMLCEQGLGRSVHWKEESGRDYRWNTNARSSEGQDQRMHTHGCDEIVMFIDLIPRDWKCGDQNYPVKWMVTVNADLIVTQFDALDLDHGMFPAAICAPNTTGYDLFPVSHLATAYGQQQVVDWLITSHIDSVRKVMNDMLVVDPSKVEIDDLLDPGPGKIIRLKQSSYGEAGIDSYIRQLNVNTVTMNHITEARAFIDFINRTLGTDDLISGDMSNLPERPTATGINAAKAGALSRLQRHALLIGAQSMRDIGHQEAYNTLQFMSQDVAVSILGRYETHLRAELGLPQGEDECFVSPYDLEATFDVEPFDGSLPGQENVQAMTEVMKTALAIEGVAPMVFGGLDMPGMFLAWARKSGFGDVQDFIKSTGGGFQGTTMPDEQVRAEADAGNLVSVGQALQLAGAA